MYLDEDIGQSEPRIKRLLEKRIRLETDKEVEGTNCSIVNIFFDYKY
jgi:hypothetical protein